MNYRQKRVKQFEKENKTFEAGQIVFIGANDLGNGVSKEQVILDYASILQRIKEKLPNTKVLVQSIYPINRKGTKTKSRS